MIETDANYPVDQNEQVIELSGVTLQGEVAMRMALVLRGSNYDHDVSRPNMDMLQELIEDWFMNNWGKATQVRICGVSHLLKHDPRLG